MEKDELEILFMVYFYDNIVKYEVWLLDNGCLN